MVEKFAARTLEKERIKFIIPPESLKLLADRNFYLKIIYNFLNIIYYRFFFNKN